MRTWRPGRPVSLVATCSPLRRGRGDPCFRIGADGALWRATLSPHGPALLRLAVRAGDGEVVAHAWGPGADWVLDGVPELLGDRDDPGGFVPDADHPKLVAAWRAQPGWRVPRSRAVFEALSASVLEQRVTGQEAHASWRALVRRYGKLAPGPAGTAGSPAAGMMVPPTPRAWAGIPTWVWLRAGVEEARRGVIVQAAGVAGRLEQTLGLTEPTEVAARLRSLPGVGVWTAAEVRQRAHGDPDAFSWADFHVARDVSWALTGQVLDDLRCAEVIERYRGHRYRVQRLLELAGHRRPRVAPRMTLPTHLPLAPTPHR